MARKVETLIDLFDFYCRKHSVSCMDNGKRTFKTVQHWQTMNPDKMLEYLDRMIPYFKRTKDTFKLNRCKEIRDKIVANPKRTAFDVEKFRNIKPFSEYAK